MVSTAGSGDQTRAARPRKERFERPRQCGKVAGNVPAIGNKARSRVGSGGVGAESEVGTRVKVGQEENVWGPERRRPEEQQHLGAGRWVREFWKGMGTAIGQEGECGHEWEGAGEPERERERAGASAASRAGKQVGKGTEGNGKGRGDEDR